MTCEFVKISGGTAIICTPRRRPKRCRCGAVATLLCDHPKGRGTCDSAICARCATAVGPDRHLCPDHNRLLLIAGATGRELAQGRDVGLDNGKGVENGRQWSPPSCPEESIPPARASPRARTVKKSRRAVTRRRGIQFRDLQESEVPPQGRR
jgi:hypothetical protein